MQKTSMMPHDLRLLKRRISEMTFEELKGQYNDLESKYKPEKEPT